MSFRILPNFKGLAFWMVAMPMLLAIVYYAIFASNRYVSVAQAVVRQANSEGQATMPGLALMVAGINPASREETLYLREYITSTDMLKVLESKLPFREHYADQYKDPLYWISVTASREDMLAYYQRMVKAHYDEMTGLLRVEVQAFTPEFAETVLQIILEESERFVNELSHAMAHDQLRFAQSELTLARKHYEQKTLEMVEFQNNNELVNAQASAESRAMIIGTLEADLTKQRANLKALKSTLGENTPQVRQQSVRIRALEQQLEAEKKTLVSNAAQGGRLNEIASRYRDLEIDVGIALESYKAAVVAVENARIEAGKKIRSLVKVVVPNMPDSAVYPSRVYNLFTLFLGLLLVYGITRFILATIEDHRD